VIPSLSLTMDDTGRLWIVAHYEGGEHVQEYGNWKSRTAITRARLSRDR
jgi:hypothetical protein